MTRAKSALPIALAMAILCQLQGFATPATKPKSKAPDIAFYAQGRSAFFGPFSMQVGKGLRIRAKFGYTIWSSDKPDDVYMLNFENKTYIRETAREWLDWNRRGTPDINISQVEFVGKQNFHGQPCLQYSGYQMIRNRKVKAAEFSVLEKSPNDKTLTDFWCKHFLIPSKYGFPVLVKQRVGPDMQTILDITTQPMPLEKVSLTIPKEYKHTTDKAAFYFSDGSGALSKSQLEEFFRQPLK